MNSELPVVLSCGEPAGIGPEIAEKAWQALSEEMTFFWIGDRRHLPGTVPHQNIDAPEQAKAAMANGLPVLEHRFAADSRPAQPDPANAVSVVQVIELACALVNQGKASALCTAPINKKALQDGAGFQFPGHTEFLADLCGTSRAVMMLASDTLRVVPVTIHIPLADVVTHLTPALLDETLRLTHSALSTDFGIENPTLAVAGLNPHAGEGGAMGMQEVQFIAPLLDKLRAEGMDILGPLSADTMFHGRARQNYDAAVAMYHDQALIPIKTLAFDEGVNVTLGLPIVRTSPDHGTAFDIAGHGIANPSSLVAALRMARDIARKRG